MKAGGGGVLRSNDGEWVAGFTRKLRNMSSTIAELWALKDGLHVARQLGIDNICIEMDADFIVHLVSNPSVVNLMLEPLLTDYRNLIKTFPNHTVTHVFREANGYAVLLAWVQIATMILMFIFCITHRMWWLTYQLEKKLELLIVTNLLFRSFNPSVVYPKKRRINFFKKSVQLEKSNNVESIVNLFLQ